MSWRFWGARMQQLDRAGFELLRAGASVIEADGFGEKVLRLSDGSFLKLFRRKRWLSSTAWHPYAQRFADNVDALRALGIPCPHVIGVFRILAIRRDAVHYQPLEGAILRGLIDCTGDGEAAAALREKLGAFIAMLHRQGVYFRSLHLGNVVLTPDGSLGLIDVADMQIATRPLSHRRRVRNFRHLFRVRRDRSWLLVDGGARLFAGYDQPRVRQALSVTGGPVP